MFFSMKKRRLPFLHACLALLMVLLMAPNSQASVTLSPANFPDDNFRSVVASASGHNDGDTFDESSLTRLVAAGCDITSLKGLELLTSLTYLDVSDNSGLTTGADLTGLTALTTLKASNCNLRDLSAVTSSHSGNTYSGFILGSGNSAIRYLDLSHNDWFYYSGNLQYLTNLETLLLNDCANFDYWGYQPGNSMAHLKWVDVSNCPAMDRIYLRGATQLRHLDAHGTQVQGFTTNPSSTATSLHYIVLSANSPIEYLNIADCAITNAGLNGITTYGASSLDTLIVRGNSDFGYSTAFQQMSSLSYLDISDCDIYFREGSSPNYYLLHYLTPANNPQLETLLASNSNLGTNTSGLTGYSALKTVDVSGNSGIAHFWVNGSPLLESLDISGCTGMTYLQLNDDSLPRSSFNLIGADDCTSLTSLYLNGNNYSSVGQATGDFASISSLEFLYLENNSGFAGGALTMTASDCGTLTGISLGNNGFTSFKAPSLPSTLTALMLGNNPALTRLEMHNNPGITTMTASTTMSAGSGLYLLGNTALTYMDISGDSIQPNHFQRIGNNSSLNGVPIDTLKASYNKFYTFRNLSVARTARTYEYYENGAYHYASTDQHKTHHAWWNPSPAQPDSASLEQLTKLRYLDLSHCQLKDSVYLHKNTDLRYLDLSHNRTIERHDTRQYPDKGAGYRAAGGSTTNTVTSYPDYRKYLWLASSSSTGLEPYTGDYNDTTGLYILDLSHNPMLEYLNISYTGIEQTALTHCHVSLARYIWIQDLPNLKYFYADYNGMRSLGVSTKNGTSNKEALKSLERLSAIGMRGADNVTMHGSINLHGNVNTKLHYVNFAYSDYDSIGCGSRRIEDGVLIDDVAYMLDTLIITGNPIHYLNVQHNDSITYIDARECAFKMRGYDPETQVTYPPNVDIYKNGARIDGWYFDDNTNDFPSDDSSYPVTSPFSGLKAVRAYNRPKLTTLLLDNCNGLNDVYCYNDPLLTKINGFENLAYPKPEVDDKYHYDINYTDSLKLVWVNDNPSFIELDLTKNVNLEYLHAYNDKALGDALESDGLNLNNNVKLISAWVSNSRLQRFENGAREHLDTLRIWQNPDLTELYVHENTGLKLLDLHNCQVRNLDMSHCSELTYFDCCNLDSINEVTGRPQWEPYYNYGFLLPGSVPKSKHEPGLNSIADLEFAGTSLGTVIVDRNDLFSITGLKNNAGLRRLTYSYNHINAIDLSGCNSIDTYDCTHNGRGAFEAEYARWLVRNGEKVDTCHFYYLQLDPDAGDELEPDKHDSYLGYKCGHDTIEVEGDNPYFRVFDADGFIPDSVAQFTLNSSGPYLGTRGENTSLRSIIFNSDSIPDPNDIYGLVVALDTTTNEFKKGYNYIEYEYYDGRKIATRDGQMQPAKSTFYMIWTAPPSPTDVKETTEDGLAQATVIKERYYDIHGAEHSEPFEGVNIVVQVMSDGSTRSFKILK